MAPTMAVRSWTYRRSRSCIPLKAFTATEISASHRDAGQDGPAATPLLRLGAQSRAHVLSSSVRVRAGLSARAELQSHGLKRGHGYRGESGAETHQAETLLTLDGEAHQAETVLMLYGLQRGHGCRGERHKPASWPPARMQLWETTASALFVN